jgi:hypothetical protein
VQKISSADASTVLRSAGTSLRKLATRNRELETKVAAYEKKSRCEKIASAMTSKGMNSELSDEEKVASLMGLPDGELDVYEKAVDLTPGDGLNMEAVPGSSGGRETGGGLSNLLLNGAAE